jgi:hypothetical protein
MTGKIRTYTTLEENCAENVPGKFGLVPGSTFRGA